MKLNPFQLIHLLSVNPRLLLLASLLFVCSLAARAQIFSGYTVVTNSTYAPILSSFLTVSNYATQPVATHTLMVTNITTNETIFVSYGAQFPGAAGSNMYVVGAFYTNFPASNGWVNGSTWTWQIPAQFYQVPVTPWANFYPSNNVTTAIPTNGVIML